MFNQQLMNMKIQLKYLQNRTSNIRQDYIRKRYREAINHPLIDFTMRSLYCILPIDRPNFITLSHLFMKVDLNIKVKGYYIKLLHPTNRNGIIASLYTENIMIASLLGVFAFSSFWTIKEIFEQEERVKKGWFPKNPKRIYKF